MTDPQRLTPGHAEHHDAPRSLERRVLLRASGISLVALSGAPGFLDQLALAAPQARPGGPVLVTIFLRGAMDGLMAVSPLGDPSLERLRPNLALGSGRNRDVRPLELDGRFGLHPSLSPLMPHWSTGELGIVHAVGSPYPTRSHFDAQDYLETGLPGRKGDEPGWLNRLATLLPDRGPLDTVALTGRMPRSLEGSERAVAIDDLDRFRLPGTPPELNRRLWRLFERSDDALLRDRSRELIAALDLFSQRELDAYRRERGAPYPTTELGQALLQIAFLIRSGVGLQIAFAESTGWDTHVGQGVATGSFANRASDLSRSLAAFWSDLEQHRRDVVVLTMTEFGRTVRENGSGGTDHGHGSCLFVLGQGVEGGEVLGTFPELDEENLFERRDLPVTTDFRSVFADVAGQLFGVNRDDLLFPGWQGQRMQMLWR